MPGTPATFLVAAWRLLRREADAVLALTGALVFLPAFATLLAADPIPPLPEGPRDQAAMAAWMDTVIAWGGQGNALLYLLADVVALYGAAAVALLLVAPARPTVGEALVQAARRIVPFALLNLAVAVPVGLGLWLFVLPGLYAQARLSVALPLLAGDPRAGVGAALAGSVRRTRGRGLAITGALVAVFLVQWIVAVPLLSADTWLRAPGNENPFVLFLVDAGIAAAGAAWHVAALLVGVVAYRTGRA
ncbi:hypothetical protein [Sphingomonas corticis]|jgi:hypothetical protein|uniref:Glycerophosphoryl diester phosphodiesterase membrane domain-containing protein n=1 Tax=Sphingomonas corticis TaxID=2722791 RepID=A0ABX1CWA8_9SPHN|nr:hypothetical protein [Sphingomonas corticis]NJR80255.1 hypothetical protein [Sphingomonas corticis]